MASTAVSSAARAISSRPRVVVVGTGWAGFRFARSVDRHHFDVVVVSPRDHFIFTPLLASTTVGTVEFRAIIEPIRILSELKYYEAEVAAIDLKDKTVRCVDSTVLFGQDEPHRKFTVNYDYLVLAAGARSQTFSIPGVEQHAMFLKQVGDARKIRQRIVHVFERACQPGISEEERRNLLSFVVVGGGPTSIEFASELYDFVQEDVTRWYGPTLAAEVRVAVLEAGKNILGSFDRKLADYTTKLFKQRNIEVFTEAKVKRVLKEGVELEDGSTIKASLIVWSTGVAPIPLIKNMDCPKDARSGRILVDGHLRVSSLTGVFALGDCAVNKEEPLPCTAQVAQQQGKYLADLFNNSKLAPQILEPNNADAKPFKYHHLAMLAYVGGWNAIADIKNFAATGFGTWLFWRSAYWTKNVSIRNKILIPMYWFKAWIFGRDISSF